MFRIGWYGLGSMGQAMATNLQRHLAAQKAPNLTFSNRTMSRGDVLKSLGAKPKTDFKEVVAKCDIIFTMVSNNQVHNTLIQNAVTSEHDLRGKIFVDCSTIHPGTVQESVEKLRAKEASFLAAPVFGGPSIAEEGKLVFAIGGPKEASEVVKPFIQDVMGRKVIDCGEDASRASLLKVAGNIVTLNLMEAVAEAQVFAEKTDLGTDLMEEVIGEAFGPIAGGYSKRLTTGAYAPHPYSLPGFSVSNAIKDAGIAISIAKKHSAFVPGLRIARNNMEIARRYAGRHLDSTSMYGTLRQQSRMEFWNEKARQD
ncbi:NAD(P)-dependent oxidoreductase [Aspergillus affinis]|uniref:NAD(P)-dependent oxidoreductase n=1 Tax=Aspergillus affinis TaxID=1070780 RepID=UPI0022FF07A6|nr:uncharacterized protein KD926_002051 [Aspergillus affinis]KAI9036339.1 hypothetical protein KD926_002051 [Aspergillus affinis]